MDTQAQLSCHPPHVAGLQPPLQPTHPQPWCASHHVWVCQGQQVCAAPRAFARPRGSALCSCAPTLPPSPTCWAVAVGSAAGSRGGSRRRSRRGGECQRGSEGRGQFIRYTPTSARVQPQTGHICLTPLEEKQENGCLIHMYRHLTSLPPAPARTARHKRTRRPTAAAITEGVAQPSWSPWARGHMCTGISFLHSPFHHSLLVPRIRDQHLGFSTTGSLIPHPPCHQPHRPQCGVTVRAPHIMDCSRLSRPGGIFFPRPACSSFCAASASRPRRPDPSPATLRSAAASRLAVSAAISCGVARACR